MSTKCSFKLSEYLGKFFKHTRLCILTEKKIDFNFSRAATKLSNSLLFFVLSLDLLEFCLQWWYFGFHLEVFFSDLAVVAALTQPGFTGGLCVSALIIQILLWMAVYVNYLAHLLISAICQKQWESAPQIFLHFILFLSTGLFLTGSNWRLCGVAKSCCNCWWWNVRQRQQIWW